MSLRFPLALAACLAIVSCGGNPFVATTVPPVGPGTPGTPSPGGIPPALAGNLQSAVYNESAGTLRLVMSPLTASTGTSGTEFVMNRAPSLDRNGFLAFTRQETGSNRLTVALFNTSANGAASAGVAASGQFAQPVWGATYSANQPFSAPLSGGVANYRGQYAGIQNRGPSVPGTGNPAEDPSLLRRTSGDVRLSADFAANKVEGTISNRTISDLGVGETNPEDIFLNISTINPDGSFGGNVSYRAPSIFEDTPQPIGTYGGTFAGSGATAAGGAVEFDVGSPIRERGVFVVDGCGSPQPAVCP